MYVVRNRGAYAQLGYAEPMPVAPTLAATPPVSNAGQAVGLCLAFFSTLMFFTSMMMQGSKR
jgi:hypothetical protein